MILGAPIRLSTGGPLPTEFRLFVKGMNETENGSFLFDDVAARSVMAAYKAWGVDLAIDLDHQMLDGTGADPTARDARGWCRLELRPDGSLWAVGVTWTPDGARRLTNKTQRYVSPAFEADPKTKRILKLINIALVALPATHHTPALIAASARGRKPGLIKQALDAVENGDSKAALALLKQLLVSAAGAAPDGDDEDGAVELTASERKACRAQGCSYRNFLDVRRLFGMGPE
jgi:phage I-like protein